MKRTTLAAVEHARDWPWRRIFIGVGALLLLNAVLSATSWWPTPAVRPDARLAPEFVGLWLVLLALVATTGGLSRRAAAWLTGAYLVLVLWRYIDVTAPSLFGRQVSLYWDVPQLPRFLWVAARDHAWWQSALVVTVATTLLWLLARMLHAGIAACAREAVPYALTRRWTWGVTAGATALAIANYAGVQATWPYVSKPVVPVMLHQIGLVIGAASPTHLARTLPRADALDAALTNPQGALAALAGRDVYLIFLESVGAVTFDNPRAAAALAPVRAELARTIAASGRHAVSAMFRSPTFGGTSDLAHLSLLAGIDLTDSRRHDLLVTTQRPTLNTLFRRAGYRTFGLYPAVSWDWPERGYYEFDVYLEGRNLDYRGPPFGFWFIPDQYSLARFEAMHPRDATAAPRFVTFVTINCHIPFNPVTPYQPDWQRVLGPNPFDAEAVAAAQSTRTRWLDMFPDYVKLVEYTYRWIEGFLTLPEPRDTVFLLVGDHQPSANVSGEGARWDVPVTVIARDAALLAPLLARGFGAGLTPPSVPLGGFHDLTPMLLEAFAGNRTAEVAKR
ncbi:MAG: sulfatase-like hydrolase/transferase [Burkholderiales bacterium]